MKYKLLRWLAPFVVLSLLVGACGGSDDDGDDGGGGIIDEDVSDDPQQAFEDALAALAEYEGIAVVVSLESTAETLSSLGDEGDRIPEDVAEAIVNSSLTIAASGKTAEDAQIQLVANVDGNEDAVELRVVNKSLYARAEIRELVAAFGGDTSELDALAEQGAASGLDFLGPAIEGEWIGVENLDQLGEELTGSPAPEPDEEQIAQIGEELSAILSDNASVTSEGTDEVGAHLVVSLPLRETVEEVLSVLSDIGGLPTEASPLPDTSDIPEGDLELDAWVNDGQLVQLQLDLLEIAELAGEDVPGGDAQVGLQLGLSEFSGGVEVPDAIIIDPQQVIEVLFGGMGMPTDF